jgi:hypothetical protein
VLSSPDRMQSVNEEVVGWKDHVIAVFQPDFSSDRIDGLRESEFRMFLSYKNNHHWTGIYRSVNTLCADMDTLRFGLKILVDESDPIGERFTRATTAVRGLGHGIASAVLTVVYPEKYGVWNGISEESMRQLEIWPTLRGATVGERYAAVNDVLTSLATDLKIDFWSLDALWWAYLGMRDIPSS